MHGAVVARAHQRKAVCGEASPRTPGWGHCWPNAVGLELQGVDEGRVARPTPGAAQHQRSPPGMSTSIASGSATMIGGGEHRKDGQHGAADRGVPDHLGQAEDGGIRGQHERDHAVGVLAQGDLFRNIGDLYRELNILPRCASWCPSRGVRLVLSRENETVVR